MPPHAAHEPCAATAVARADRWFWEKPYRSKLVRWGTTLHDRFMLPHFVWADFRRCSTTCKAAGLPVELDWFRPHYEFRFPCYGKVERTTSRSNCGRRWSPGTCWARKAPSAAPRATSTARWSASQVKVRGLASDRYVVSCNGHPLPLTPTGTIGEVVAGVRFRAWWPPSALHPTISPHVPLTFDIVDTWNGTLAWRAAATTSSHPGGRNFDVFPVNAYEAEGRRLARFEAIGHYAGALHRTPRGASIPTTR